MSYVGGQVAWILNGHSRVLYLSGTPIPDTSVGV